MARQYAKSVVSSKNMLAGLRANREILSRWGVDEVFLTQYENAYQNILVLNDEQQALKSRLKEKTAAVHESMAALAKLHAKARNLVKMELMQESWKEFGIQAKR